MSCTYKNNRLAAAIILGTILTSCNKDDNHAPEKLATSITVENVLDSKPLVESGTFAGTGTPPLILPGQSVTIHFSAAKGEALTFATMYGWSNDLFFAPENPGIKVYDANGLPLEG